eukprot:Hpha_TRINITY_DN15627_c1_g1::TRINITY_DN15627_c1_g1_i1::g.98593::m.98593
MQAVCLVSQPETPTTTTAPRPPGQVMPSLTPRCSVESDPRRCPQWPASLPHRQRKETWRSGVLEKESRLVREAAVVLNVTVEGVIKRHALSDGEHWLTRRVVMESSEGPTRWRINLLWMLDTATRNDQVTQSLLQFIMIVALVCAFDMLLLLVEVFKLAAPLRVVADAALLIDTMQLEQMDGLLRRVDHSRLILSDVHRAVQALRFAVSSLRVYRDFLPQGCLHTRCESPSDSDAEEAPNAARDSPVPLEPVPGSRNEKGQPRLSNSHDRHVAILSLNIYRFHSVSIDKGQGWLRVVLADLLRVCAVSKGVLDGCCGDRMRASWNAAQSVSHASIHAAYGAAQVCHPVDPKMIITAGVASGQAACVVAGGTGGRYPCIVGHSPSAAFIFERLACATTAQRGGTKGVTLCDSRTILEASHLLHFRWFAKFILPKNTRHSAQIYTRHSAHMWELMSTYEERGEEWMFSRVGHEQQNPWSEYNKAVEDIIAGDIRTAVKTLKRLAEVSTQGTLKKEQVVNEGTPPRFSAEIASARREYALDLYSKLMDFRQGRGENPCGTQELCEASLAALRPGTVVGSPLEPDVTAISRC